MTRKLRKVNGEKALHDAIKKKQTKDKKRNEKQAKKKKDKLLKQYEYIYGYDD